jgi:hypothetical protein
MDGADPAANIQPNVRPVPALLDEPLRRVVALLTERLKWPEPELVDVAPMWLDMVADGRRDAALCAIPTQRMLERLVPANASPAGGAVPGVPPGTLTTNTHGSTRQPLRESPRARSARRRSYARVRRRIADWTSAREGRAGRCSRAKSIAV